MIFRAVTFIFITFSFDVFANPNPIFENTIGMEAFSRDAAIFGLEKTWPSAVVYNRQGVCVHRGAVDADWVAARFIDVGDSVKPQNGCELIVSDEPGSSIPLHSDHRTVLLYVLDAPFCDNCRLVESELRKLHASDPDGWTIRVTRVNLTESHNPVVTDKECSDCKGVLHRQ